MTANQKSSISEGSYIFLNDGTYCRVSRSWHGKNRAWLEVSYRKRKSGVNVTRSIELSEIREIANLPDSDPK